MFYDGQSFLVRKESGWSSSFELSGATVCATRGTTTELNLVDFSRQNDLNIDILTFEDTDSAVAAYEDGLCDAVTSDRSHLAALRTGFPNPGDHLVLTGTISKEPLFGI